MRDWWLNGGFPVGSQPRGSLLRAIRVRLEPHVQQQQWPLGISGSQPGASLVLPALLASFFPRSLLSTTDPRRSSMAAGLGHTWCLSGLASCLSTAGLWEQTVGLSRPTHGDEGPGVCQGPKVSGKSAGLCLSLPLAGLPGSQSVPASQSPDCSRSAAQVAQGPCPLLFRAFPRVPGMVSSLTVTRERRQSQPESWLGSGKPSSVEPGSAGLSLGLTFRICEMGVVTSPPWTSQVLLDACACCRQHQQTPTRRPFAASGDGGGGKGQPGNRASFKCLPEDLDSHCDSWSCWLPPVSLLEEEGNERVIFFFSAV